MLTGALDINEKVGKTGIVSALLVLYLFVGGLALVVGALWFSQPDKRLAVVETRLTEIDKKLDRIDNKLDRLLEK